METWDIRNGPTPAHYASLEKEFFQIFLFHTGSPFLLPYWARNYYLLWVA